MNNEDIRKLHDSHWLSERLGISLQKARTMHLKDEVPHIKIGRLVRYDEYVIEQWILDKMQAFDAKKFNINWQTGIYSEKKSIPKDFDIPEKSSSPFFNGYLIKQLQLVMEKSISK